MKRWLAVGLALLFAACAGPNPLGDEYEEEFAAIDRGSAAVVVIAEKRARGEKASKEDWSSVLESQAACDTLKAGAPAKARQIYSQGYAQAEEDYGTAIWIGERVLWVGGIAGAAGVAFALFRIFGPRLFLMLLAVLIGFGSGTREVPAAVDPVQAKLFEVAARDGHDVQTLEALIEIESSWRSQVISRSGAVGLTQLMPPAARECGLKVGEIDERFNPIRNLDGGSCYLKRMRDHFGSLELALAAYNTGPGTVRRKGVTAAGREYVRRFLRARERLGVERHG